jgi:hypothetical protein
MGPLGAGHVLARRYTFRQNVDATGVEYWATCNVMLINVPQ